MRSIVPFSKFFPLPPTASSINLLLLPPSFKTHERVASAATAIMSTAASSSSSSSSSWSCSRCTFLNPPSQKSVCQICLSPSSLSPSPPKGLTCGPGLLWSCRACTYSNPPAATSCQVCGTACGADAPADPSYRPTMGSGLEPEPEEIAHPAIGSVFLPLRRCHVGKRAAGALAEAGGEADSDRGAGKSARMEPEDEDEEVVALATPSPVVTGNASTISSRNMFKILSYNVWFREDLELHKRMEALGDLIQQHSPDFICFQEVTPDIYEIFQESSWWKQYKCSLSRQKAQSRPYFCMQMSKFNVNQFRFKEFDNSIMGRELCLADVDIGGEKKLVIATSHLESPCPAPPKWDQMYSKERISQANEAIKLLSDLPNAIFCGDMNWDDKLDGHFPQPGGWVDAWSQLKPGENGWTYDTKANKMLSGNRTLQKRLDRFVCKLQDFKINSIEMIGMEEIPGLSYVKEKRVRSELKKLVLPVLPSDHYGLLLTITRA